MKRKLFALDLDGTVLADSEKLTIHKDVKKAIKQLQENGHIVCIFTGRSWKATKKVYEELKLDTIVVNFNGAHIHNPSDYNFMPHVERLGLYCVMKIVESKEIQLIAKNIVVEGPSFIHLEKKENSHFTRTFIDIEEDSKIISPIKFSEMGAKPSGVLIEVKLEYSDQMSEMRAYLKYKYGDLASFTWWETGVNNNKIFEITSSKARKDIALIKVARHYGIEMSDTVAFGDGFNDIKMLKAAGVGVAMANANKIVKSYANVISSHTNKEGAVGKFIDWYLNGGYKEVDRTIYTFGHKIGKVEKIKR